MSYEKQWGSTHPGCLIILLDQSGSMDDAFGGTQLGAGKKKSDMVATVLNGLLHEFIKANTVGTVIKPRADVAVVGYSGGGVTSALSGSLGGKSFVTLKDLNDNPLRIDARTKKEMDDTGNIIEVPVYFPVWVEPVATGGTPMCAALHKAKELADDWVSKHPDNYPPVIFNVTDGAATDGDPSTPAKDLRSVHTSDGETLVFNVHITDKSDPQVEFPVSDSGLPNDQFAKPLFDMTSIIPDSALKNIASSTGNTLPSGSRGFIFNGDAGSVRQMFIFATVGAQALDPNR
jgi:hypothetical protein